MRYNKRLVEGMTLQGISESTGISIHTLNSRYSRGCRTIKEITQPLYGNNGGYSVSEIMKETGLSRKDVIDKLRKSGIGGCRNNVAAQDIIEKQEELITVTKLTERIKEENAQKEIDRVEHSLDEVFCAVSSYEILDFMRKELGLKGRNLLVYACIYKCVVTYGKCTLSNLDIGLLTGYKDYVITETLAELEKFSYIQRVKYINENGKEKRAILINRNVEV